ncbi:hypothetical protein V8E36_000636 [Tilletia maclaganii]
MSSATPRIDSPCRPLRQARVNHPRDHRSHALPQSPGALTPSSDWIAFVPVGGLARRRRDSKTDRDAAALDDELGTDDLEHNPPPHNGRESDQSSVKDIGRLRATSGPVVPAACALRSAPLGRGAANLGATALANAAAFRDHRKEDALGAGSCSAANDITLGTIGSKPRSCINLSDASNPAGVIQGICHSGAKKMIYTHDDAAAHAAADTAHHILFAAVKSVDGSLGAPDVAAPPETYSASTAGGDVFRHVGTEYSSRKEALSHTRTAIGLIRSTTDHHRPCYR